ncbi:MAG TPA: glycosyltransferase N-terminal domain-containing protein [Hyphomicrobiales bacterium]|nr:glycosyltransferase N-terminal domain-containing protein [Hyphomicrobiales bacterium]
MKRILRSKLFIAAASSVMAGYIRLVYATSRVVPNPDEPTETMIGDHPLIAAMWHGQFLIIPAISPPECRFQCMVARHNDAELLSRTLAKCNLGLIRGAGAGGRRKDRGGIHALRAAITALDEGKSIAMTAEVPPGPPRKASLGIVALARLSGRPVRPVAQATSRFLTFNNWSRFTLNLPFSKLAYVVGDPVYVPHDADEAQLEAARLDIERGLNEVTRRAYEAVGRDVADATPVEAGGRLKPGLSYRAYRTVSRLMRPVAGMFLRRRSRNGKEVAARLDERMGISAVPRPGKKLLWFHAASVGETNVVLPLIETLNRERPDLGILLTTVTVTSAKVAASRLPPGAIHQFVPLDTPAFVRRFLDHWKPSMALFIESEIWPNLIMDADRRRIPVVLLNARLSERSFRRWMNLRGLSRPLFARFAVVLAQSEALAKRIVKLGAPKVIAAGNLKFDAPPPPIDMAQLAWLRPIVGERRVFLAASTHPGEEEMIAEVHKGLLETDPSHLTIIVPRHPERGAEIAEALASQGISVARRSVNAPLMRETSVYIADTLGELGLFYKLAPFALIGGSLSPVGGHNPIEAAKLGCGVITGPHWHNFPEVYQALAEAGGCRFVTSPEDLLQTIRALYDDPASLAIMKANADNTVRNLGGALGITLAALEPLLPPKEASSPQGRKAYAS